MLIILYIYYPIMLFYLTIVLSIYRFTEHPVKGCHRAEAAFNGHIPHGAVCPDQQIHRHLEPLLAQVILEGIAGLLFE